MALSCAVGSFNITTAAAASTVVISGLGFQPKFILFWWSGRTESTDAGGSATYLRGFGAASSASAFWCVANRNVDAAATSETDVGLRSDACILELGAAAAVGWADLQSLDSGGFTLEILDAFTTDLRVSYAAYGGSDITNVNQGVFTETGAPPIDQIVATGGFSANLVLIASPFITGQNAPFATGANATIGIGAATSATDAYVLTAIADDGAPTGDGGSYCLKGEVIAGNPHNALPTGSPVDRATFVSFGATTFTINWAERSFSSRFFYLAVQGGTWKLGDLLTQTDTTTAITETSFGFTPNGVVFFSGTHAATTADAAPGVHDEWSIGAATSASNRVAQNASSRDGNTNMFCQTGIEFDEVYVNFDPTTDAIEGLMDVQSFDADGFTCIMDDADPAQAFVWYLACGNVPSAAAWIPRRDAPKSAGQRMRLRR